MKGERAVVGNSPGRSGPDNRGNVAVNPFEPPLTGAGDGEFHPDRGADVIFIFDFRLCEGRRIVQTPILRLTPAIDVALLHELEKRAGDGGFVVEAHGQVWVVPAAENAESLEIFFVLLAVAS